MGILFSSVLKFVEHRIIKNQITLCLVAISGPFWFSVRCYPPEPNELGKLLDPRFLLNEEQELFCRDPNPSFRYNDYGLFSPQHYLNPTHENENLINRVPNEEEMHLFHGSGDTLRNFDKHQGHDFDYGWISQYHPVSQTGHYEYDEHLRPWLDITNNFQNFQPTPNQSHFFYPSSSMPSANFFDVHQSNILPDGKQIRLTGSDQQSHNSFKDYNFASEIPSITTGFQPPSKGFLEKNQSQNLLSERESHQMDPLQLKKSFESTDYLPSAKDMIYKEIHQPHKFQSGGSYNSGYLPTNLNNFKHDVFNVANTGLNENYFQNGLQSDQPLDLDSANMFLNCECNDPSEKSSARICNSDTDATERVKKVKGVYHKQLGFLATSNIGSKNLFKKRKENLVNPVMNKVIFNEREGTKMTSNLEDFSSQQKFENLKNSSHQDKIIKSSNYKIILKSKEGKNDHEKKIKTKSQNHWFYYSINKQNFSSRLSQHWHHKI